MPAPKRKSTDAGRSLPPASNDPFTDAASYDAWFDRHPDLFAAQVAALRALLPANGRVLDIGCGSGRFSAALGATAGCDRSLAPLALARKRNARVVVADAVALPFATAGADALLLVTVLCFLPHAPAALRECRRVLRTGGLLVGGFIARDSALGKSCSERPDHPFYRHARFHNTHEIAALFVAAGFSPQSFVRPSDAGGLTFFSVCNKKGTAVVRG